MKFNPKARLDTGRIGSSKGGGGMGGGMGGLGSILGGALGGAAAGGGKSGGGRGKKGGMGIGTIIVIAIVFFLVTQCLGSGSGGLGSILSGGLNTSRVEGSSLNGGGYDYSQCVTGEDANNSDECALVAVENSLTDYWTEQPDLANRFQPPQSVHFFSGSVQTGGCGGATSAVGPFYCPADQSIYIDPTFFSSIYRQMGGQDSIFVRTYVLAHEYGHHIQNLLGNMGKVKTQQGPQSDAVRLELQADCLAGMWVGKAEGDGFIQDITDQDIQEGIDAASTVGDDSIQEKSGGRVDVSQFTHGTSAQRMAWFQKGMTTPDSIQACDTFAASNLDQP